jgi:hypothetical protein
MGNQVIGNETKASGSKILVNVNLATELRKPIRSFVRLNSKATPISIQENR